MLEYICHLRAYFFILMAMATVLIERSRKKCQTLCALAAITFHRYIHKRTSNNKIRVLDLGRFSLHNVKNEDITQLSCKSTGMASCVSNNGSCKYKLDTA